jgi:hypothetical protein
VLEKNNAAMLAWTVRDAYNPLATDLLRAVEIFADDSTFKARVIDSCTEAVAAVMKRPPELNGFTKAGNPLPPRTHRMPSPECIECIECIRPPPPPSY